MAFFHQSVVMCNYVSELVATARAVWLFLGGLAGFRFGRCGRLACLVLLLPVLPVLRAPGLLDPLCLACRACGLGIG